MTPFFSIIIPLFNGAATLPSLLDSIAAQDNRDVELIVMDGGSTDGALSLITAFERAYRDIRVIVCSEPDKGIYDAMNKSIGRAAGEWLFFIGSDDRFCDGEVLRAVRQEIEKAPVDLIYGNVEGLPSRARYVFDSEAKVLSRGIHHQSVFYRRSLFDDLGRYDLAFSAAADYAFTLKVFFNWNYKKRHINLDIAYYGEEGYSSANFDYKFFSGHCRLLAANNVLDRTEDPTKCLTDSIYCCYYLAGQKKDLAAAWSNLLFYVFRLKQGSLYFRTAVFFNMLKRTIARPGKFNVTP